MRYRVYDKNIVSKTYVFYMEPRDIEKRAFDDLLRIECDADELIIYGEKNFPKNLNGIFLKFTGY